MALGISGLGGSYLTEAAERKRNLRETEGQTLSDLRDTHIGHTNRPASIIVAIVDGRSPFAAPLLVLSPFLLAALLPRRPTPTTSHVAWPC